MKIMTEQQTNLNDRAEDIMDFALCATGGDVDDALAFVCEAIDETRIDILVSEYMGKWGNADDALEAASFKSARKEAIKEDMV